VRFLRDRNLNFNSYLETLLGSKLKRTKWIKKLIIPVTLISRQHNTDRNFNLRYKICMCFYRSHITCYIREFPDINAFLLEFKRVMQIAMILDWPDGTVQCANSFHLMIKSVLYCSNFMTEQHPHSRYTPEYINKNICLNLINKELY